MKWIFGTVGILLSVFAVMTIYIQILGLFLGALDAESIIVMLIAFAVTVNILCTIIITRKISNIGKNSREVDAEENTQKPTETEN